MSIKKVWPAFCLAITIAACSPTSSTEAQPGFTANKPAQGSTENGRGGAPEVTPKEPPKVALTPNGPDKKPPKVLQVMPGNKGPTGAAKPIKKAPTMPNKADVPKSTKSIATVMKETGQLQTFWGLIEEAGVSAELMTGEWTIFAPSDDAFKKFDGGLLQRVKTRKEALRAFVLAHMVKSAAPFKFIKEQPACLSAANIKLKIESKDGKVTINGAEIIKSDLGADHGVVFVVDRVIRPGETY